MIKLIECPRDAMQGIEDFIPTDLKADYINLLLKTGFDTIDFGSFVSPKAIPQMRDTGEVLAKLNLSDSTSKLLAIIANTRGAHDACQFDEISYLGFPLSVSESFQQRNTNKSIAEALEVIEEIQNLCISKDKTQVVYISMGFGNPYNDPYNPEIVATLTEKLVSLGIKTIALSDTIGVSSPDIIIPLYQTLVRTFPKTEFGVHLHSNPRTAMEKIEAAYQAGCKRFDGALRGFGGCPMAKDELTGNIATENIVSFLDKIQENHKIDNNKLAEAIQFSSKIFH